MYSLVKRLSNSLIAQVAKYEPAIQAIVDSYISPSFFTVFIGRYR